MVFSRLKSAKKYHKELVEGGSNLGDGKNGGNNISGSDMPTYNVDLVDQHCRDISGWAVTQRSRFNNMYHWFGIVSYCIVCGYCLDLLPC